MFTVSWRDPKQSAENINNLAGFFRKDLVT